MSIVAYLAILMLLYCQLNWCIRTTVDLVIYEREICITPILVVRAHL